MKTPAFRLPFRFLPALLLAAALLPGAPARADISMTSGPTIIDEGGGIFRWEYAVEVLANENVFPLDFFTIYDVSFGPLVSIITPAGWTATQANSGIAGVSTPLGTTPTDSPVLNNITWTSTGLILGPASLGSFGFRTNTNLTVSRPDNFAGQGTNAVSGLPEGNVETVLVPNAVPEPGTMVLFALGAAGLGIWKRRRRSEPPVES
jgi:hypothetical protein